VLESRPRDISEVRDAQGNGVALTYDLQYRLVALTNALGQVTTLSLASSAQHGEADTIVTLSTPYGATTFAHGMNADGPPVEVTGHAARRMAQA
jgi:YD repeat-containing protein